MTKRANHSWRHGFSFSVIMVCVLAVLVPLLAFLQYRWIGQVSELEREQLQQGLNRSNRDFVVDIQREFGRIPREFQFRFRRETLETQLAEGYQEWLVNSQQPNLIQSIYVVEWLSETGYGWRRFDPVTDTLEPTAPAFGSAELPRWLDPRNDDPILSFSDGLGDTAWFVIPRLRTNWVLVEVDAQLLWSQLVPDMVAAHFDESVYNIVLLDPFVPDRILYRSEPNLSPASFAEPDSASLFFSLQDPRTRGRGGRGAQATADGRPIIQVNAFRRGGSFDVVGAGFELLAQHQAGSLGNRVAQLRRRNLIVGFGILTLLAATGAMIIVWAERVRAVGRLQMEFAAGISHELRTPLATIRTAAHNIAAGIVKQPEQIREYAGIVQTEGRRLSSMVDQVIQFAQTEAGRRSYDLTPTDVRSVIERATATLEEAQGRIQTHIETDLPPALADETALTHCVGNLLANALKFGAEGEPIVIDARYDIHTDRILIGVENRGLGIESQDLPHLFEPFYRGHNVGQLPGSGLGLSLVQRMIEGQKGRVTVSSEPGEGTVFTLQVPAAKLETVPTEALSES